MIPRRYATCLLGLAGAVVFDSLVRSFDFRHIHDSFTHSFDFLHIHVPVAGDEFTIPSPSAAIASSSSSSHSQSPAVRTHVIQAAPHRPPLTHVITMRAAVVRR